MPIPASHALVPFRPFMTVRVAEFDDEPAAFRTYATREDCERDLFDWIAESVIPDDISCGCFNPGEGWYTFTACEHGELRHRRGEYPGWRLALRSLARGGRGPSRHRCRPRAAVLILARPAPKGAGLSSCCRLPAAWPQRRLWRHSGPAIPGRFRVSPAVTGTAPPLAVPGPVHGRLPAWTGGDTMNA